MAKAKPVKASATPVAAAPAKVLNGIKAGRVQKPSQSEKSKAKERTKSPAVKKELEKKIRQPSPSDDDESADDSADDSSEESESEAVSDADSDDSSASESEKKRVTAKANVKAKANGVNKEDDSDSASEDDDSEVEQAKPKANGVGASSKAAAKHGASSDVDSDSSESDDDNIADVGKFQPDSDASDDTSDDDEEGDDSASEAGKGQAKAAPAAKANGATKAVSAPANAAEADSEDSSDDSSESEQEKEDAKPLPQKRKADDVAEPVAKKTRVESTSEGDSGASKTLFIGRLSWNVDDESLLQEFQEFGEIVSCKVMYHKDSGKSKGFGYVEFSTGDEASAAKEAKHEAIIDGRPINVDFATPFQGNKQRDPKDSYQQRTKRFGDVESAPSSTLFVGNISFDATYDLIKEAFESYGSIERISLPTSREDGTPKGFGYVSFSTTAEATEALNNLRGSEIAGRPVRLDYATPRPEGDNNGGGFRGGRGGNRGGGRGGFGGRGGGGFGGGGFGGGRGGGRGGSRGGSRGGFGGRGGGTTNRGGFGDFTGKKISF